MHPKQEKIVAYLHQRTGDPPTIREIMEHVELKSTSATTYHLQVLEITGHITSDRGRARSIRLADTVTLTFVGDEAEAVKRVGREAIVEFCQREEVGLLNK
jgi:SOS-response transcriptional repressor LexA